MKPEEIACANSECSNTVIKQTHNQKYCSDVCCRIVTNLKIKEKYYEDKQRLSGKKRICANRGCSNVLSRYNTESTCLQCENKVKNNSRAELLEIMSNVVG